MPRRTPSLALGITSALALTLLAACSAAPDDGGAMESATSAASAAAKRIRFGVAPQWYQGYDPPREGPASVDAVVVGDWLIENGFTDAHQRKISQILSKKKIPYFFGYIATAMTKRGLGQYSDCDGDSSKKLCQEGADYLRRHLDADIVPVYRAAAERIGRAVGGAEALIHIEPDFYQFSERAQRNAFSRDESNRAMNKILGAIRGGCPTCRVVIDFSPWFSPDRTTWARSAGDFYVGWDRGVVKYVGLTGKPFPFTEGKIDNFTYGQISAELGLPLVVVDGYTFGGGPIDIDRTWLNEGNLAKASAMGVAFVFLSQQGDVAGFDRFVRDLRGGAPPPGPTTEPEAPPRPEPPRPEPPKPEPPKPEPPAPPPAGGGAPRVDGGDVRADVTTTSVWQTGYCSQVRLTNRDSRAVEWTARVPRRGTLTQSWSSVLRVEGSDWVFRGVDYNRVLAPGQTADFGFCADTSR